MATPNLYVNSDVNPFADVPESLRGSTIDVLYVTDRKPASGSAPRPAYGFERSTSMALGVASIALGDQLSWEQLVAASRTNERRGAIPISVHQTREILRFPSVPLPLAKEDDGRVVEDSAALAAMEVAENAFRYELGARLAQATCRDVYVYIHGFNNTFDEAVTVIGELWHFLGRRGVGFAYSWPAGGSSPLMGYTYDIESAQFTVFHLKQTLLLIGSCPEVERVHIIAHSRGTDVALTALRELHLQCQSRPELTRATLKLGFVVLAAPDLDRDVTAQRMSAERLFSVPRALALYVSQDDLALAVAKWLFKSIARLGQLRAKDLSEADKIALRTLPNIQVIQTPPTGGLGHDYFHSSPAVSSDIILLLRDGLAAGPGNGRPLIRDPSALWRMPRDYPRSIAAP